MTSKTEGRRCACAAATPRRAKQPPPRRLGAAFAKMMGRCPKTVSAAPQAWQKRHVNRRQVAAYGACVREKIADGALERDACAREFAAMKKGGAAPKPPGVAPKPPSGDEPLSSSSATVLSRGGTTYISLDLRAPRRCFAEVRRLK